MASRKATDLLHRAIHTLSYCHIAMAIKMASKVDSFFQHCFVWCRSGGCPDNTEQLFHHRYFACDPDPSSRRSDTERVVTRWRRPVTSGVVLDMLHQAMLSVSHCCTAMAIKMASDGGTFIPCLCLFCLL